MLRSWVWAGRWWQRVPGHKSHGRKGIFVWPRCSLDALPSHPVQSHSLCMSRTFKIMSFLSKARTGRSGQVRFLWLQRENRNVTFSRHWKGLTTKSIVARGSIIKTHYTHIIALTFWDTTRSNKAVNTFSSLDMDFHSSLAPQQTLYGPYKYALFEWRNVFCAAFGKRFVAAVCHQSLT